jgi:hypothetical protein
VCSSRINLTSRKTHSDAISPSDIVLGVNESQRRTHEQRRPALPESEQETSGDLSRASYWLLIGLIFPCLDVAAFWWLNTHVFNVRTLAWSADMVTWFTTIIVVFLTEVLILVALGEGRKAVSLKTVLTVSTVLLMSGLVWLAGAEIIHALVISSGIPSD